jgi:hypothetical protein
MLADSLDDLWFCPPSDWSRRTTVTFSAPPPSDRTQSLEMVVLAREPFPQRETLTSLAARHIMGLGGVPGFRLRDNTKLEVNGLPAARVSYEWLGPDGAIEHTMVLVETPEDGTLTTITTTCSVEKSDGMRLVVAGILETAQFGQPRRPPSATPTSGIRATSLEAIPPMSFVPIPGEPRGR